MIKHLRAAAEYIINEKTLLADGWQASSADAQVKHFIDSSPKYAADKDDAAEAVKFLNGDGKNAFSQEQRKRIMHFFAREVMCWPRFSD